jgi:hypothetical protein
MPQRRWYNPHVPQTLGIAQILLYINAVFTLLYDVMAGRFGAPAGVRILFIASVAAYVFGAHGIANERKIGWQVAVAASISPFAIRFLDAAVFARGIGIDQVLRYTLGLSGRGLLSTIFDIALVALLLHPMSRNHQKVWFS